MEQDPSVHHLMARLHDRDEAAARQVFQRYAEQLIGLARHNLRPLMRAKMDPEDVVQSVMQSFFVRQAAGEFAGVDSWNDLWKVLVTLTLRKCGRRVTHFFADRRDVHREVSQPTEVDQSGDSGWEALFADPTVAEAAQLTEMVEALMNGLGKDDPRGQRNRQILALRLQGYQVLEISEKLGCTARTVCRVLERVRDLLDRMQAEDH